MAEGRDIQLADCPSHNLPDHRQGSFAGSRSSRAIQAILFSGSIWDVLSRNRLREFRLGAGALHDPSHVPRPDFFGGRLYKRSRRQSQCKVTSDSSRMRVARSVVAGLGCSFLRTSGQASCRALAEGSDIRCASIASLHGDV